MLWWDECTQLLLAKTVKQNPLEFHDYNIGGWHVESGKAHLFPWLLALLGANQQVGIIFNALLSLVVSCLLFKIAEREFGETVALLSVLIMLSFVDPFLLYSVKLYNHMLAIALSLLSIYLMQNGRQAASAIAFGFSIISRYDTWPTAAPLIYLLVKDNPDEWKPKIKSFSMIALAIASIQFVLSDILEFGIPFFSLIYESGIFLGISAVNQPLYYFWRFLGGNPMSAVFLVASIPFLWKAKKGLFLAWLIPALVYFEVLTPFKSLRFLITILPIFSLLAAFGFTSLFGKLFGRNKSIIVVAILLFMVYNAFLAVSQKVFVTYALADDNRLKDAIDFVGDKIVVTNTFSPLACYSSAKIFILPPDEEQFQKLKFDYLLVLSESFKPDYLNNALSDLEKVNYEKRTYTGYEYGTLDLYVRENPSG